MHDKFTIVANVFILKSLVWRLKEFLKFLLNLLLRLSYLKSQIPPIALQSKLILDDTLSTLICSKFKLLLEWCFSQIMLFLNSLSTANVIIILVVDITPSTTTVNTWCLTSLSWKSLSMNICGLLSYLLSLNVLILRSFSEGLVLVLWVIAIASQIWLW